MYLIKTVNGQWSSWSKYGGCSATCGGGSQYRSRKCDNPAPANGGEPCVGPSQQSRSCNSHPCKSNVTLIFMPHIFMHVARDFTASSSL